VQRGFVKLWRKSLDTEIFKDPYLNQLWDYCTMKASWKDDVVNWKTGRGSVLVPIKRGQFVFGRFVAAKALGCPASSIPLRLQNLSRRNMIDIQPGTHYSIITVLNYRHYQDEEEEQQSGIQSGNRSPIGQASVTYKKLKNNTSPSGVADADAWKGKPKIKTYFDEHGIPYPVLPSRPPEDTQPDPEAEHPAEHLAEHLHDQVEDTEEGR